MSARQQARVTALLHRANAALRNLIPGVGHLLYYLDLPPAARR